MGHAKFRYLEHTADLKFEAFGKTLSEALENAALAMFSAIVELNEIEIKSEKKIGFRYENVEDLVHDWLNELLFLFSVDGWLFKEFKVRVNEGEKTFAGVARGEVYNQKKHRLELEIKAITYHDLVVEKIKHKGEILWRVQVVCDT